MHIARKTSLILALIAATALSGCASLEAGWPWTSTERPPQDVAVAEPPASEPEPNEAAILPMPAVPVAKPANLGIEPEDLIGLSQDQVLDYFGAPLRMIDESPAVRWQYEDGRCALTLVFFPDLKTERFVTLQYNVEGDREDVCLVRIARAQQKR
jgi:hypothetical protein